MGIYDGFLVQAYTGGSIMFENVPFEGQRRNILVYSAIPLRY
jgi:hypothetical protein